MDGKYTKCLFLFLGIWCIYWSLMPIVFMPGVYFDVAENIEWGRYWQFGYDKHPFVSMWISRFFYELFGGRQAVMYFLCGISIASAVLCVWLLAKKMLPAKTAFAAAMMTLSLQYFSSWALEFNNDVIAISVWSAGTLFFYRALEKQRPADWLLTAFFCFLAVMTKYYAVVLFAAMFFVVLFSERGRESFRHSGMYLAGLFFLLLVTPNILWLVEHDFQPFTYASESAKVAKSDHFLILRLSETFEFVRSILERLAFFIVIFLLCFFRKDKNAEKSGSFDRFFIWSILLVPLILTLLVPALFGGRVKPTWLASCFSFLALAVFMIRPPEITRRTISLLCVSIGIVGFILSVEYVYARAFKFPYQDRRVCCYEAYPGDEIAQKAESLWRERYGNAPLRYVIGSRKTATYFSLASKFHPSAFLYANLKISPWVNPDEVRLFGAVVVWEIERGRADSIPKNFRIESYQDRMEIYPPVLFDRKGHALSRLIMKKEVKKVRIGLAFLPPGSAVKPNPVLTKH